MIVEDFPRIDAQSVNFRRPPEWALELGRNGNLPEVVLIADPLSYCSGVERGLEIADNKKNASLYHPPIHNQTKLEELEGKGNKVVNDLYLVEPYSTLIISAHGASPQIMEEAKAKNLEVIDTTCPFVENTHKAVRRLAKEGYKIILIGEEKHDEIVGIVGEAPEDITVLHHKAPQEKINLVLKQLSAEKIAVRNQTTLNDNEVQEIIDYIKTRRPDLNVPSKSDVCTATRDRQASLLKTIAELKRVTPGQELMIIFGSDETTRSPSGNSIRLRELSLSQGIRTHLIEDISKIESSWFVGVRCVGVSAGASAAPERVEEFRNAFIGCGLKEDQFRKVKVESKHPVFKPAEVSDYRNL